MQSRHLATASAATLSLTLAAGAGATEDPDAVSAPDSVITTLGEVVVTATRYERALEEIPANVSVITREEIADSTARDVPELLGRHAGLHAYDITGNGRAYRVDRSGFGETAGQNTLVLVDGRRLNNPDLSGSDWLLIPLGGIERLEVVRGARGSVLYGDNASDAVINIVTRTGGGAPTAGAGIAIGSYDTWSPSAYLSGSSGGLDYFADARYLDTDGYRENSASRQGDLGLGLGYSPTDGLRLDLGAGWHEDDTGLPGALRQSELDAGVDRRDSMYPNDYADTRDGYLQLTPRLDLPHWGWIEVPLSYRNRDAVFYSSFVGGEFHGDTGIETWTAAPQLVIRHPLGGMDNSLTIGLDWFSADESIENTTSFFGQLSVGRFDLRKDNSGLYLQDELSVNDRLTLVGGYRWDRVHYSFSPVTPGTSDSTDYSENVLSAGATWQLLDEAWLYASYSQGFRYPALDELFNFFTNTIDADLKPQTSDDYEIGLRSRLGSGGYADINLFRIETRDEIHLDPYSFANTNLDGTTRRDGLELSAGYDAGSFGISATYVYRDAEIRGGTYSGNEVPNVPMHQGSIDLLWRPLPGLTLALNGLYVGSRYLEGDYANAFERQDPYTVLSLKLEYSRRRITAFLDINNLLNEEYSAYGVLSTFPVEPAYYPSPQINLLAGVRYDL